MLAILGCLALLTVSDPDVTRAYQEARAKATRSPEDQVRLALWAEAHGLTTERLNHLALAVLADPKNAAARGLMGLVSHEGKWQRPEAVADKAQADPNLAEYDARRSRTAYTADAQWLLGVWADEHGLKDQAKAHFTAVVRLDPSRENAWKRLGYKRHENQWITDSQVAARKADLEAQKQADRHWKPTLERLKAQLDQPSKRLEADTALDALHDPRAVPSIGRVFLASEATQPLAVRLLGQIDSQGSSRVLASLSISAKSAQVRRAATETLRGRDPREYANLLIGLIHDPIKYEVKPVGGPGSPGVLYVEGQKANLKRLYSPNTPFQSGDSVGIDRFGQPVVRRVLDFYAYSKGGNPFNPRILTGMYTSYADLYSSRSQGSGDLGYLGITVDTPRDTSMGSMVNSTGNQFSLADLESLAKGGHPASISAANSRGPVRISSPYSFLPNSFDARDVARETDAEFPLAQMMAEASKAAYASQQQLAGDVANLEANNRSINQVNDRVVGVLNATTGQSLPTERARWERWWVDVLGYAQVVGQTATNPTIVEVVPSSYQPQVTPSNIISSQLMINGVSCFGAGTLVQTIAGPRPIESLKVGDRVLTQSVTTGALGYQPILVVHHNPPGATFRVQIRGDSIIASHFHRFWVAGRGWVLARDLKVGDPVRTLGGVAPVELVDPDKVQLVYNLDVAEDADFFAGHVAALVHDNTLPDPRLSPFDAVVSTGGVARRGD